MGFGGFGSVSVISRRNGRQNKVKAKHANYTNKTID
jgi:hypothetical protein